MKYMDELAGLTAQQWKNFAFIYAQPCFSGLLTTPAYKSLCHLCRIVELVIKPIISDEIAILHRLINEHHKLFAAKYGKWEVTINYHVAFHLPDVISNYGPSHGY